MSRTPTPFDEALATSLRPYRLSLWLTAFAAAGVAAAATTLLGLSGWFLTAAAMAGALGPILAQSFNYLLPAAAIRGLAIARTGLRYAERYLGHAAALRAMAVLRPVMFARLSAADPALSLRLSRGDTTARFVNDVSVLEASIIARASPFAAAGGALAALLLSFAAGLGAVLALTGFMALSVALGAVLRRQWLQATSAEPAASAEVKAALMARLSSAADMRFIDQRPTQEHVLNPVEDRLDAARASIVSVEALLWLKTGLIANLCLPVLVLLTTGGADRVALVVLAATAAFESLTQFDQALSQRARQQAARQRVAESFDLPTPVPVACDPLLWLAGRSFAPGPGLRLLIDGPSGSGKTRLLEALTGLRSHDEAPQLRGHYDPALFSLCPQDTTPLTGTLLTNLLPDGRALPPEDIETALFDAALLDRVKALPGGLGTWVGDGGISLSGGERKRLALARTLLRPAPILLLDEPTEGLDAVTEALVVTRLGARLERTQQGLILISHRPAPRALTHDHLAL